MKLNSTDNDRANRELLLSKMLNVPVEYLGNIWTKPEHIIHWWGPAGFTHTIHSMDLWHGGEWRLTMRGSDRKNYTNKSIFVETHPHKKRVFQHYNPNYLATILFLPYANATCLE